VVGVGWRGSFRDGFVDVDQVAMTRTEARVQRIVDP
jgi:hypothetical protein